MVGEGRGGVAPPLEIGKKLLSEEILTFFTYEIRGESIHCTSKVEGWADRRVSIVEGERGPCPPPPPKNGKKMLSEGILTLFTYVLPMKLGGLTNTSCIHAK